MNRCSPRVVSIQNCDKFSLMQGPKNDVKHKEMESILYASIIGSLIYLQICTRPNISFAVGMLGMYQNNLGNYHWKAAKSV